MLGGSEQRIDRRCLGRIVLGVRPNRFQSVSLPSVPERYLPVSSPPASGDHRATPRPRLSAIGRSSRSALRSTRLYSTWMAMIGASPRRSAMVAARATRQAGKFDKPAWWILPARTKSSKAATISSIGVMVSGQ